MSAAAVTKSASKPFWIARYARATARCVFPRPGLPKRISERPSVTKSADRYEPMPDGRLVREVEVVDGLEEGEAGSPGDLLESRLLAVRDLLREEHAQELLVGPLLLLGAGAEVAPHAASVGEVEPLEQRVDGDLGLHSGRTSCRRTGSGLCR
jgi:hypothetical protein